MDKNKNVERHIIGYVWIYAIIVILILFFASGMKPVLPISVALVTATSLLCFTITIRSVDRIIEYDTEHARGILIRANIEKYLLYLVVLVVAGLSYKFQQEKTVHLDIIATACGFFSVRLMIYFKEFVIDKIFKHNRGRDVDSVSFPEGTELFPEKEDEEKENEYDEKLKKLIAKEQEEKAKENGDDNDAVAS